MTVIIPLFGERISPHFSTAPEALVVESEGGCVSMRKLDLSSLSLSERKAKIVSLGADMICCGGIDRATRNWFERKGIRVNYNLIGNAMEVVQRCLNAQGPFA